MILYCNSGKINICDTPLSKGGEGSVYKIPSMPNYCAKLYHPGKVNNEKVKKIVYMVSHKPANLISNNYRICWPTDLLYDTNKRFVGFIMPLAFEGSQLLYQLCKGKINGSLSRDWHQFYDRNSRDGLINRLKLIVNIVTPIYDIHNTSKYVLVDFKPNNVMITANVKISMIDLDSVQIVDNSIKYMAPAFTVEYLPPELQRNPKLGKDTLDVTCDLFAMAVVFYQLLYGIHPFMVSAKDSSCTELCQNIINGYFPFGCHSSKIAVIPKPHKKFLLLPSEIKSLFILAFENNPKNRPLTSKWGETVYKFLEPLVNKK